MVTALISSAGARKVAAETIVPSRSRVLRAARNPSVVYASSMGSSRLLDGSACSRWSATQSVSTAVWSNRSVSEASSSRIGLSGHE